MARFLIRVELHSPDKDSYDMLHSAMDGAGFSRTIIGGGNIAYHLPTAEYYIETELTANQVLNLARGAAAKTKKENGVIVAPTTGCTWLGLIPVRN